MALQLAAVIPQKDENNSACTAEYAAVCVAVDCIRRRQHPLVAMAGGVQQGDLVAGEDFGKGGGGGGRGVKYMVEIEAQR